MADGRKLFDVRRDDRGFAVGDRLNLREWNPIDEAYTGRAIQREVTFILPGGRFGIEPGHCVLGVKPP